MSVRAPASSSGYLPVFASSPFSQNDSMTNPEMTRRERISTVARKEVEAYLADINAELRTEEQHLKDLAARLNSSHRIAIAVGSAGSITGGAGAAIAADSPIVGFTIAVLGTAASLISGTIIKCCSRTSLQYHYASKNVKELNSERTKFNDYFAQPLFLETAYQCYQTYLELNPGGDSFIQFLYNKENIEVVKKQMFFNRLLTNKNIVYCRKTVFINLNRHY